MAKAGKCLIGMVVGSGLLLIALGAAAADCNAKICDWDGTVTLTWVPSAVSDLAGYNLYRYSQTGEDLVETRLNSELIASSGCDGGPSGGEITYVDDSGLEEGTTYWYAVTAVDCVGNESAKSAFSAEIVVDFSPPVLGVLSPFQTKVGVDDVPVIVTVQDFSCQVELLINESEWYVMEVPGTHYSRFSLNEGANVLTIQATDMCGNVATRSRTVHYSPEQEEPTPTASAVTGVGLAALLLLVLAGGIVGAWSSARGRTDGTEAGRLGTGGGNLR